MALHLASLWNRGFGKLGKGLLRAKQTGGQSFIESNIRVWFVVPFIIGEIEGINGPRSIY